MRRFVLAAVLVALGAVSASAQAMMDPDMSCTEYLKAVVKMGPTPKSGDAAADKMAADMDAKMAAHCKANPAEKLSVAMEKVMLAN